MKVKSLVSFNGLETGKVYDVLHEFKTVFEIDCDNYSFRFHPKKLFYIIPEYEEGQFFRKIWWLFRRFFRRLFLSDRDLECAVRCPCPSLECKKGVRK